VVERDGKVLVIRRHLDGRDYAVLPGGGIEDGEAPGDAALRELREECTLDGRVAEFLLEGDHGGRAAFYYRVTGVEGEPELGGEEAEGQDETNQHHPMWASPQDLELMDLLPDGLAGLVAGWLWPFRVRAVSSPADREVVEHLWQPYCHDLSEFRGSTPGPDGTFKRGHLDFFRPGDPDSVAYLAQLGDRPIGFALARGLTTDCRQMGEFFVARAARGTGHARTIAEALLRAHPGRWEIAFQEDNTRAARFWPPLASDVRTGAAEEPRPVPGKPHIPPDVWLDGSVAG